MLRAVLAQLKHVILIKCQLTIANPVDNKHAKIVVTFGFLSKEKCAGSRKELYQLWVVELICVEDPKLNIPLLQ